MFCFEMTGNMVISFEVFSTLLADIFMVSMKFDHMIFHESNCSEHFFTFETFDCSVCVHGENMPFELSWKMCKKGTFVTIQPLLDLFRARFVLYIVGAGNYS